MCEINLARPGVFMPKIKYEIVTYPDGQKNFVLCSDIGKNSEVLIKSHLNSFSDLELIICATKALKNVGVNDITLYIPYFLGARSDRKFEKGSTNYLKDVICPIINLQKYKKVVVLDPHSDVLEACLDNFEKISNYDLVQSAFDDYYGNLDQLSDFKNVCLISPDAGAFKKVYDVAKSIDYTEEIVIANKVRDIKSGKILRTDVPIDINTVYKDYFIIDDICDGGRTFIEIVKSIKETRKFSSAVHPDNYGNFYLIVTHGLFSQGFDELSEHFTKIYTTNSIKEIKNDRIFQKTVI